MFERASCTRLYFLLQKLSRLCYQLLMPGNLQSSWTEGDRRQLPVALCQSKWLTFLGIATRWQTVILLFLMLRIIMGMANLSSWFSVCFNCSPGCGGLIRSSTDRRPKVSFHFQSCLLVSTALNRSFISLPEPHSF